ncbi:MAG TPA: hypothetical protein VL947_08565 [Cytophagales bacterium]|nr:hypothetical protein [Cytophagales bacterium]
MNHLVYLTYGKKEIIFECLYSILSLFKVDKNVDETLKITVYTDHPELFSIFPAGKIRLVSIDAEDLKKYKGPYDFVFRPKIEALIAASHELEGKILYCDSDIYFLKSPQVLFEKITHDSYLMCNYEEEVGENPKSNVSKRYIGFLKKEHNFLQQNDIHIHPHTPMWNAGVLGLYAQDRKKLEEVLFVTDTICSKFYSHITEQLAFSYCFAKNHHIHVCEDVVFHYWNFKEFREVLVAFFEYHFTNGTQLDEVLQDMESIRPDVLSKPKRDYEALSFWPKALRKLKGKKNRWKMPQYTIGQRPHRK